MEFQKEDILSATQFSKEDIEKVIAVAKEFESVVEEKQGVDLLKGKIMASLFFEPSTRTRLSFETAMIRLGGQVISVSGKESSSMNKGETLADTGRTIEQYADVIVMRHPEEGSVREMADSVEVPVINAGDGAGQHPTQGLLDLYTMQAECGKLDGLTVTMMGDLKYGRTVHSLAIFLSHFDVKLIFVSPAELKMPEHICEILKKRGVEVEEMSDLAEAVKKSDVVYNTRVQQERFSSKEEYEKFKGCYLIDRKLIEENNPDVVVMHPLPRLDELSTDVDELKGAAYFRQPKNGVKVRMALLALVMGAK